MKLKHCLVTALLAAALASPTVAQAQMRALGDPVVGHPDPESLFASRDRAVNRNKQPRCHPARIAAVQPV